MRRYWSRWPILLTLGFALLFGRKTLAQTAIQYVYDDAGRLISVVDPAGDTAVYHYDAVGNVTSIDRHSSSQVSITWFSPGVGPTGTTVAIFGTGFSSTPSQDAVTFNGTAATVSSASTTKLVVTVPAGATSGLLSVTTPNGSASSASAFTVATTTGAPTITGFTPSIGTAGTAVSISGTNFETSPASDRVTLNTQLAGMTSASATALGITTPSGVLGSHLTVTTPHGTAVSAGDFFVPPLSYVASDVDATGRLTFSTPTTATISTANKVALLLFDGTAGQRVSISGTNGVSGQLFFQCDIDVSVFNPNGTPLAGPVCMEGSGLVDATTLPTTGTYTVLVDPESTVTGSVTLTTYDVHDTAGTITPGGSSATVTITTPGQNGTLTFSGTAGHRIALSGSATGFNTTFGCELNVTILKPDSTTLAGPTCMETEGYIDVTALPTTGTYTIVVDPVGAVTGSLTLTLYDVPADASGTITPTPEGSSATVTITTPGQNGALTFSGTAGHRIYLSGSATGFNTTFGCELNVTILKPDSTTLAGPTCMETEGYIDVTALPATGTYTILVDPVGAATGTLTLTLYDVPADAAGTITPGGSAVTISTSVPGQNASLTFTGTAGHRISLLGTDVTYGGTFFTCDVSVSILKPDGTTLVPWTCMEGGSFIDATTLPASGTYTLVIDPYSADTGSMTLTLYDVPADPTSTITPGGSAVTLSTSVPGQNASLTFSGDSGQQVSLVGSNVTYGGTAFTCDVSVSMLKPDGTTLVAPTCMEGGGSINAITLPVSGTYTIAIDPYTADTGSITVTVTTP